MTRPTCRQYVTTQLRWLIDEPTCQPSAGLTCYRERLGISDLFSIYVTFGILPEESPPWKTARIFAVAESMESRLPSVGERLIVTSGVEPVAIAEVLSKGEELI